MCLFSDILIEKCLACFQKKKNEFTCLKVFSEFTASAMNVWIYLDFVFVWLV